MSDSINVSIKVRPLIKREKDDNLTIQWAVQGNSIVSTDPDMKKRGDGKFQFDHIFDMDVTNLDVFSTIVKPIVDAAINGFNGTVFAYGQTSSGKTYTMMGTMEEPGVVPLAIDHLFGAISNTTGREFLLRVSYLEIHKERVNDLLNKTNLDLKLHEDSTGQVVLKCKEEITNSSENLLSIMQKGEKNRRIGETNMNERSSRSHTIFRITIESREADADSDGAIQVSQLNLVDLAGSERARQTGATGERFDEGRCINKSLSTLGLVIMQLSESQENQKHVNFRDSKLTRLLQSSLGGNAMTAIICAVTPAALEETQCTLSFASRAKSVKNKPQLNEVMSDAALLKRYARQLAKLENELAILKNGTRAAEVEEMESKLLEKDRTNQLLEERIELLKTRILSGAIRNEDESLACKSRRRTWCGPTTFKQRLSVFDTDAVLPTIKEMSPEKVCTRKSIMQNVDIMNQTFQTAFADFEIELIESERDRENGSDSEEELFITKRRYGRRVKFMNDVQTRRDSINTTPERREMSTQTLRNDQISPSTPKDVLRKTICELSKDYRELQEFSTLEKQVFCEENQCRMRGVERQLFPESEKCDRKIAETQTDIIQHEIDKYIMEEGIKVKRQVLDIPDIKEQLKNCGLNGEDNFQRILTELCVKLKEAEGEKVSRAEANKKMSKRHAELETELKNITSERNEYEFMNRELRAELKKKRTELELHMMTQTDAEELTKEKILQMEKEIETISSDKIKLEHINSELGKKTAGLEMENQEMAKRIAELEKQVEIATIQKDQPVVINHDLRHEINEITTELEPKTVSELTFNEDITKQISSLEDEIQRITSKNNDFQNVNHDLRTELNNKISECELKVEKITELEKLMDQIMSEKAQYEKINQHLHTELNKKATDLEEQIEKFISERSEFENVSHGLRVELENKISECETKTEKISELEEEMKNITSEKCQLQQINQDLHAELSKISAEIESKTVSEVQTNGNVTNQIPTLQQEIVKVTCEKGGSDNIDYELRAELQNKISECEMKNKKISELEEEMKNIATEKCQLQQINQDLHAELSKVSTEVETRTVSEIAINEDITKQISAEQQIEKITSEKNEFENIIHVLRTQLQNKISDCELNVKKISDLEKQIQNITSERNEFENIIHVLRTELQNKISDCELNVKKISDLEKQIQNITSERNEFENIIHGLRTELQNKISEYELNVNKISDLEKHTENITSERNEFENIIHGLRTELQNKISEYELNVNKISDLEKHTENITSERNEFENIIHGLRTELQNKISEFELNIKKISDLEKHIESITSERNEFENVNQGLRSECELIIEKISELEKQIENITSEKNELENNNRGLRAECEFNIEKISELEKQIENITSEQSEFEHIRTELSKKTLDLESKIISVEVENEERKAKILQLQQNTESLTAEKMNLEGTSRELRTRLELMIEKISELERQTEDAVSKKDEFERKYTELSNELNKKISELESKVSLEQTEKQEARRKIVEFEGHLENITSERNDFERNICEVRSELDEKCSKLELTMEQKSKLEKQIEEMTLQKNKLELLDTEDHDEPKEKIENVESKDECHSTNETDSLKSYKVNLQDHINNIQIKTDNTRGELTKHTILPPAEINESNEERSSAIFNLKEENIKLAVELELKVQEVEEIKNDVKGLKDDIESLQKTIYLLTTENMDMSMKLSTEREFSKDMEVNLQKRIDDLYARISKVTEEKINLEGDLTDVNKELENVRWSVTEKCDNEQLFHKYQSKIDRLKAENIELSAVVVEKNRELENIKESKSLLFDHECIYKENVALLAEKNESLTSENNELSSDLMDRIEENDMLKEECDGLKKKLEVFVTKASNSDENNIEQLRSENSILIGEITELKAKVTMLSEENAKLSNNLLETIEDLDNSRSQRSHNNTFNLSMTFDDSKLGETSDEISTENNHDVLLNKVKKLQDKVNHLTRLNKKLCDLKLTSCSQCAHLKNLRESHRTLKIETKILNHKLEELQKNFELKCAQSEAIKLRADQELNLSLCDTSFNSSITDGMNVSFVEEKVQHLNNELQVLKNHHDKLSVLYKEKCSELEKLNVTESSDVKNNSKIKEQGNKMDVRIDEIQKCLDDVKNDIDNVKKNNSSFCSTLNKFKGEKESLIHEIRALQKINEELTQKVSSSEISVAAATEKVQIYENELSVMSKQVEQFSLREKTNDSERLNLEVELECLQTEKEAKDVIIGELHRTIDELNEYISTLKNELDSVINQRTDLAVSMESTQRRYQDELEVLKKQNKELKEKIGGTEAKEVVMSAATELKKDIEKLQMSLTQKESICNDLQNNVSYLKGLLEESNNENMYLKKNLETLKVESTNSLRMAEEKYKSEMNSTLKEFKEHEEIQLQEINQRFIVCIEENNGFKEVLAKLKDIEKDYDKVKEENEDMFKERRKLTEDNKRLCEDLNGVKECMLQELKSLTGKMTDANFFEKPVKEIYMIFLQTFMSKEVDVIKTMRERFEKDKQKVEDEKQQCADAEKRMASWAKELEMEIDKLQTDQTKRESVHREHQEKIYQLEHALKESNHDKDIFKEQVNTLEAELFKLRTEFDKQCKVDCHQEEAVIIAQKKEKEAQEAFRSKEIEFQLKIKFEKENYQKQIDNLTSTVESYKAKNLELTGVIEDLEANEKQLKNIIDANSMELKKNHQVIHTLSVDVEQLTKLYEEANCVIHKKESHIDEIATHLKRKCDKLFEYKSKLESVMPDYELLQEQVKERKANIERYKEEIEKLKVERAEAIQDIQDKLNMEEIKNSGLQKQLAELNNKNIVLMTELSEMTEKYEELQRENTKLERKIRNSTSKIKAEAEIEELKDLNKRLQNNLEGASNRITDLQDNKNQMLKELVTLKGQYDLVSQENVELQKTVESYKLKQGNQSLLSKDDKYHTLLEERNKIALELEGKKLLLSHREKELEKYTLEISKLTEENKALDKELDDYAQIIRERDAEIAALEHRLDSKLVENETINKLESKIQEFEEEKKSLNSNIIEFIRKVHTGSKEIEELKSQNDKLSKEIKILQALRKENAELHTQLSDYDNKFDLRSNSSGSRSASPAFETNRRRHSRNEIFNQRRHLDNTLFDVSPNEYDNNGETLRNKIQELELEIVSKNGKIAALELQIQSENFPYQRKCKELEEQLFAYHKKNTELKSEMRRLQRAINDVNTWECDICRRWRENRRDQGCQTIPNNNIRLCSTNSGVVEYHNKIVKLENEKKLMKELCRSRSQRIKDLEKKIKDIEVSHGLQVADDMQITDDPESRMVLRSIESPQRKSNQLDTVTSFDKQFDPRKNLTPALKENIPANLLDFTKASNERRNIWRNN